MVLIIEYYELIKENALAYSIQEIKPIEIDTHGITWANVQAMERAAKKVETEITEVNLFVIDQSPCKLTATSNRLSDWNSNLEIFIDFQERFNKPTQLKLI